MSDSPASTGTGVASDPPGLIASLARSWPLLLATTILFAAAGGFLSSLTPPQYQATARLVLTEPGETTLFRPSSSRDVERRLLDAAERLRAPEVTARAATALGPDWTADELRGATWARADLERTRLTVVGRAGTAEEAARVTNALVRAYEEVATEHELAQADAAIAQLTRYLDELEATAETTRTELDALRVDIERDLVGFTPDERIRTATSRLAIDPRAQVLQRRLNDALTELSMLRQEARKVRIDATLQGSGVESVDPAPAPAAPSRPRPVRDAALAGVLGFLLAAALAWTRAERRPGEVRGRDAAAILGAPVLAEIPVLDAVSVEAGPEPNDAEPYRTALTALEFALHRTGGTSALVTSASAGDGRTQTALSLAVVAAHERQRVVLVDADLRTAGLSRATGLGNAAGWADHTGDGAAEPAPRYPVVSRADRTSCLHVTPTGTAHNGDRPDVRARFPRALGDALAQADLVLVDAPPLLPLPDVAVLAESVSGIVLVLPPRLRLETVEQLRWRLAALDAPLLGCVVNRARRRPLRARLRARFSRSRRRPGGRDLPPADAPRRNGQRRAERPAGQGDAVGDRIASGTRSSGGAP